MHEAPYPRGVHLDKATGRWRAVVTVDGRKHWLGRHNTADAAARAVETFRESGMGAVSVPAPAPVEGCIHIPLCSFDGAVRAYALIDIEDAHLAEHNWHLNSTGYVVRNLQTRAVSCMTREIHGLAAGDPRQVDHRNHDKLDNRRRNLRIATAAENAQNRVARRGFTSRFRGVSWYSSREKWIATVVVQRQRHFLGYFDDETEAADAARRFRLAHMPFTIESDGS